jgi:hypothetical protein
MRKLLAVIACVACFSLTSISASAAETHSNCATFDNNGNIVSVVPSCSETQILKNQTFSMPSANPCTAVPGILTFDFTNAIFHITVNGASDVWVTQTETGSISFAPTDTSQPSYLGHIATWFGASLNKSNTVFHDTFNASLTGTDGSTISAHMVDHMSVSASGMQNTFSVASFSCG